MRQETKNFCFPLCTEYISHVKADFFICVNSYGAYQPGYFPHQSSFLLPRGEKESSTEILVGKPHGMLILCVKGGGAGHRVVTKVKYVNTNCQKKLF